MFTTYTTLGLCKLVKGCNQLERAKAINIAYAVIAITAFTITIMHPELSEAATNNAHGVVAGEAELNSALTNIKSLVSGVIGKIITIVALGFGLAGSIFKFNPVAIAGSFGVALTAAFGPSAVMAVVGATF